MLIITSFSYLKLISKQSINEPEITGKSLVFVCLALQRTIVMKNAMHTIIKKTVVMEILHDYLLKLIKFTLHNFLWSFFRCFFLLFPVHRSVWCMTCKSWSKLWYVSILLSVDHLRGIDFHFSRILINTFSLKSLF